MDKAFQIAALYGCEQIDYERGVGIKKYYHICQPNVKAGWLLLDEIIQAGNWDK